MILAKLRNVDRLNRFLSDIELCGVSGFDFFVCGRMHCLDKYARSGFDNFSPIASSEMIGGQVDKIRAEMLLLKCRGDEIWSVEHCKEQRIPDAWIEEMQDCFESGFDTDRNTIYENEQLVNQYHGVSDLMIAYRLAEFLGIETERIRSSVPGRSAQVVALQNELDEI